ncbi:M20/M25/M40 family metallo-hydrolase [Brevundimonas sp.]|uniref:M20/M25/M40 family metallo-hydrolase n=1 Tax=Brevundimonas sp. TaxID=1871086 RepID=UPI0025FB7E44|nr:M20/M25/M40 family metallo-hydrolase [Brevundimonas sp.]
MRPFAWFAGALVTAVLLALWAIQPPAPRGADAPAGAFSAARAMPDVEMMARQPHPTGSPENARVRDRLLARLTEMGLEPRVQRASVLRAWQPGYGAGAWVENIIAVLPGRDRTGPAVVLMSHYDSAPGSPGAADDAAGVAASLEVVRALVASGEDRERDLILLITDAEEQGLLGAQAFFESHPLRERVGAVVNLEARGSAGRAFMFETGPDNGAMIGLYQRAVRQPTGTSLATYLYSVLPNDTDFSHPRDLGVAGFNLAFIGEPFHYHSPTSTPAELDQGSLQHIGDQALDLTRALVTTGALPGRAPDAVFSDVFGLFTVTYPAWGGWLLILVSGLVLAGMIITGERAAGPRVRGVGVGLAAGLGVLVLSMGLARLALIGTGASIDFVEVRPLLGRLGAFEAVLFVAGLAAALGVGWLACRGRGRGERPWELPALGVLTLGWLIAVGLQAFAPEAAPVAAWPVLAGLLGALAARRLGTAGWTAAAVIGGLGAAFMLALAHGVFLGVGWTNPEGPGAFALLALLPLTILWARGAATRWGLIAGLVALVAAGAGVAWLRSAPQATVEHPGFTHILHVADPATGEHRRISQLRLLHSWTRQALEGGGGQVSPGDEPALWAEDIHRAPAPAVEAAEPPMGVERFSDGRIGVRLLPGAVRELRLTLESEAPLRGLEVNGRAVEPAPAGEPVRIRWSAPQAGVSLILTPPEGQEVRLRWAAVTDGWPADATPLPERPGMLAPWGSSDGLAVVGERVLPAA